MPRELSDWLDSFLAYQERSEAPILYQKWVGLSTLAAVLQRKVWLPWEVDIFPNLYIVLVGPSSARKGTAMAPALQLLRELEIETSADSVTREALIRSMKLINYTYKDADTGEPILHSSMTIFSPELAVFLGYNNPDLISALTDWFDCRDPWTYLTINRGSDRIEKTWVNLIGATTPDLLPKILPQDAIGGGLTSRIIFVYSPRSTRVIPFPQPTPAQILLQTQLRTDLKQIHKLQGEFTMSKEYAALYEPWYEDSVLHPVIEDPRFENYLGRRSLHLKKISMVLSASCKDTLVLEETDFLRAKEMLEEAERVMTRIYAGYGRAYYAQFLPRIEAMIAERKELRFAAIIERFMNDLEQKELTDIVATLAALDPPFCFLKHKKDENGIPRAWVIYNEEQRKTQ